MDTMIEVDFVPLGFESKTLGKTNEELMIQWNLKDNLNISAFRIIGSCPAAPVLNINSFAKCLFSNSNVLRALQINDAPPAKIELKSTPLLTSVRTMAFFDKLFSAGIVSPTGSLRGCYEEIYHGFSVGDKLREMFINEESENSSLFSAVEQSELLYHFLKLFATGGTMCQPDIEIDRYLNMAKSLYKELVTIYRASDTKEVKISTRAAQIHSVAGLDLFEGSDNAMNSLYLLIDPVKKVVYVVRTRIRSHW